MRSFVRFLSELVRPTRTARAIPLGRLAILSMFVFVVLFVLFTLRSMGVQLPFVSHPYRINAEFPDAVGLDPSNGPPVAVAGVPEGQVTAVRLDGRRARVTMELNPDARGKLFRDATVRVRPFNGANFLELDVQPGHGATGAMPDGGVIDASRTSVPVATDQVLDVLDADTRAYVQLLTEQTAIALHGGGGELGHALQRLAPLSTSARQISDTLATRRRLISALVGEMNSIFHTLGNRHVELARTLSALTRLLAVTGSRTREIAAATRDLPSVLTQVDTTGGAVANAGPELEQALQQIAPAATAFASGLRATRGAIPSLQLLLSAARSLADRTRTPSSELVSLTSRLGEGISSAIAGYENLTTIMRDIVAHQDPIAHFSEAISGVLSTQDSYGVLGRVKIIGIEGPRAEDLGLAAADTRRAAGGPSKLETMLASALRSMCLRSQPLACLIAAATPGLPTSVVPLSHAPVPLLSPTPPGTR